MKVAILGGTFDPVHIGHLLMAQEIQGQFGFGRVLFMPTNAPAHKVEQPHSGAAHRVAMLRLAVQGFPEFVVDDREVRRGGVSYTIDTLRELEQSGELEDTPALVIGDDLVPSFGSWKEAPEVAGQCTLIVVHRAHRERVPFDYPHLYCDNMLLPVSSSLLRERLRRGKPVRGLVPEPVYRYIREHGLYRD